MEFTFLGTSAGTPTRSRNVTGLALSQSGHNPWYLVDCGEGTQHQLLCTHYSVLQLRAIFITHIHGDHTFGLPGLLTSASMLGRTEPLDIIAAEQVARFARDANLPNLVLTYFSSRYQSSPGGASPIDQLAAEASQHYPGQLFLARDFDRYRLEKDLSLTCLTTSGPSG